MQRFLCDRRWRIVLDRILLAFALVGIGVATADELPKSSAAIVRGPLSPEESLKHFVLGDPNLQIEIVAAEPEVIDPVAIQFDEHGRLWVVEMRDYPTGPKEAPPPLGGPDAKPLSRIKLLEDKNGDGRYETAHIFADNLLFATGVQPWDGGVIVTLAGEVAYFKDTDGDHKADVRETWFTGFSQGNTQLRANHPTFGPDGWIYVANGLRGGDVIAVKKDWSRGEGQGSRGEGQGSRGEGQGARNEERERAEERGPRDERKAKTKDDSSLAPRPSPLTPRPSPLTPRPSARLPHRPRLQIRSAHRAVRGDLWQRTVRDDV